MRRDDARGEDNTTERREKGEKRERKERKGEYDVEYTEVIIKISIKVNKNKMKEDPK